MMDNEILRTALLCLTLEYFDTIKGKTRLQKIIYFANLIGWNAFKDYLFYQYGPYSEGLKNELEILRRNEIVIEETGNTLDNRTIYNYRLTEEGKSFTKEILNHIKKVDLIQNTRKLFEILSNYSSDDLEIVASLLFLKRSDPLKDNTKLVSLVKLYKDRFSLEQIEQNLKVMDVIQGLVPTS